MKIPVLSLFACLFALPSSVSAGELQAADQTGGAAQGGERLADSIERGEGTPRSLVSTVRMASRFSG